MDRTSSQILQANEKAKARSTIIGNFGTALTIAGVATLWVSGLDPWPIVWIAFGIVTMMCGTHVLSYLEAEN